MYFRAGFLFTLATLATVPAYSKEIVNVYSYRQSELVQPLFDAFTEQTGITVNSVYLKSGMTERLSAEGDRSPADLAFTVDIGRLISLKNAGVLQKVDSRSLTQAIPKKYRDSDGMWYGLTTRARIVYASKDRVGDGEVTTYEDLASEKWRGRICVRSGTNAYNLALIAAMIEHHGVEITKTWLEGVKANLARKPQGNDRAQVKAIAAGECDISIGNTYYMALMLRDPDQKAWAESVRIVFPTFEDGGTHMNISGVAMTKSSPNRENALKLMEFLASDEGQSLYASVNYEYPISSDIPAVKIMEAFGTFSEDHAELSQIANLRADALRLVELVNFDK